VKILPKSRWYPAFVIYRWRHLLWALPVLALLGVLHLHWSRLRWDHAMAVYGAHSSSRGFSGSMASRVSKLFDLIQSPEILGGAARDSGLTTAWRMNEAQAAERLSGYVSCDMVGDGFMFELKVRKIPEGDSLQVCEALEKNLAEKLRVIIDAREAQARAEGRVVLAKAVLQLEAKLAANRPEPVELGQAWVESPSHFDARMMNQAECQVLEQLKAKLASGGRYGCGMEALTQCSAPHWPKGPSPARWQQFGIAAGWTFGVSVLLAIALAYVLEFWVPRRPVDESITTP